MTRVYKQDWIHVYIQGHMNVYFHVLKQCYQAEQLLLAYPIFVITRPRKLIFPKNQWSTYPSQLPAYNEGLVIIFLNDGAFCKTKHLFFNSCKCTPYNVNQYSSCCTQVPFSHIDCDCGGSAEYLQMLQVWEFPCSWLSVSAKYSSSNFIWNSGISSCMENFPQSQSYPFFFTVLLA